MMHKNKNIFSEMRKFLYSIILFLTLLVVSFYSYSQTTKGLWLVGGNFNFSHDEGTTSISLSPTGGYLLTSHLALGTEVYSRVSFFKDFNSFNLSIHPFIRYYLLNGKFQPFLTISGGPHYHKYLNKADWLEPDEEHKWDFNWRSSAGLSYFVSNHVAVEGQLIYHMSYESFGINFGFQIFLGNHED